MIFVDVEALANEILGSIKAPAIVGIDGWTGAGKTSLAGALALATAGSVFDIDTALIQDQNCFVPALRLEEDRDALAEPGGLLFVSGICLRQVLSLVQREAEAHVYVKRVAAWGWADQDDLVGDIPEVANASGAALRREMRVYHHEWKPHLKADYEFHWHG